MEFITSMFWQTTRTNHVSGIESHPHQVRLTPTAQSGGAAAAAHVLMFGLLQWGGRLCIDAVTQHNHVFSYVHSFSEFPPLNNYNTAASGPGQTLIKSLLVLCQILCGSFLLTPDLRSLYTFTINISTDRHQDTYRTDVHFVLVWFSRPVVANPSIAIYRLISQSSLSITELSELSGLTGCGCAADQLCIGCQLFKRQSVCYLRRSCWFIFCIAFETSRFIY